jgi:hypothetical protein
MYFQNGKKISNSDFFEVRVTRRMTAVDRLNKKKAIPLTEELAQFYVGPLFRNENKNMRPYLVRGLYANETGEHRLFWYNESLIIQHSSLGHSAEPEFSPLVVNLPSEPKDIYIIISVAE